MRTLEQFKIGDWVYMPGSEDTDDYDVVDGADVVAFEDDKVIVEIPSGRRISVSSDEIRQMPTRMCEYHKWEISSLACAEPCTHCKRGYFNDDTEPCSFYIGSDENPYFQ